jgi:hypothetical protein
MDLGPHVDSIHRQFAVVADVGGDDARVLAERLFVPLEAAIRLAMLDALAVAADEITLEMAPGSVEVRVRGGEPEFVVTPSPPRPSWVADDAFDLGMEQGPEAVGSPSSSDGDEGPVARINVRMPGHLKTRVETAAGREGISVNTWLVRAAAAALERASPPRSRPLHGSGTRQRYSGWAR